MRLIDADELLSYIDRVKNSGLGKQKSIEYITKYIMTMQTAYNVDKVVEQLEETREKDIPRINNTTTKRDEKVYKLAMSYAIDIVKAGGLNE